MNLYQNPNFYGYQQPQINPYMQRMENLQQFQQAIQQPMLPTSMSGANQQLIPLGKIVESVDIVKVTDIPMDVLFSTSRRTGNLWQEIFT